MFTVLQRHVSIHTSRLQARTILVYKFTVLIQGYQALTCFLHGCYLLYYNRNFSVQMIHFILCFVLKYPSQQDKR